MSPDTNARSFPADRIVVATTNAGKIRELNELFSELSIELKGLDDYGILETPKETGSTFEQNARIKASGYAIQIGEWVIADDSGLEIEFLGGEPGVHSARFGGESTGYAEKMRIVLDRLSSADDHERAARFISVIALANPAGEIALTARGECRGAIAYEPRGSKGFGYDPIFLPEGSATTFGEMSDEEKRSHSHRAHSADDLIRKMLDFTGV